MEAREVQGLDGWVDGSAELLKELEELDNGFLRG